jgi:hypothetical protein
MTAAIVSKIAETNLAHDDCRDGQILPATAHQEQDDDRPDQTDQWPFPA